MTDEFKIALPKLAYEVEISNGIIFSVNGDYKMPNTWHRFWHKLLLGWHYKAGE